MPSIVVNDEGIELSYIDSGIPQKGTFVHRYITIFAIHGFRFTNHMFDRFMAQAYDAKMRFVAISRRDHPGSTPLAPQDLTDLAEHGEEDKQAFLQARGLEIASFVDRFIEQNGLLPISSDRKTGGIVILGHGIGCVFALSAVASLDTLSASVQQRWGAHMRALLLHEPMTVSIGKPRLPEAWGPRNLPSTLIDEQWLTSYFKQWDLNARNLSIYSYDITPSIAKLPTIASMSEDEIVRIFTEFPLSSSDLPFIIACQQQIKACYKKACFDEDIRGLMPNMKIWVFSGDRTLPFSLPAYWAMEDDNDARGGGYLHFRIVHNVNHFAHWAEPALILRLYQDALQLPH
ncbi:hypothetical protein BD309DRAFT_498107 [Dichomitus squalens]|uniref:AB hydrolase-1 domain-containing protein n=1 Tax=Dichomitus squalens TaxID=114155 RepID=A0A4Q9QDG3_9APHY|nr:hypothetical protein BD309DRAFT_498107 [Dichomitus squalens]TBU65380.1 hypothetical protein BD310DRAFT_804513 [Dichomitus squalens]